ncbi:MAG: ATP-binding cassette domain-containing protein, partial [Deltaproteobacteria bacterium]
MKKKNLLVLDNINFDIKKGEIISLLGKSGSGKSTLLRIIAGLIKPSLGHVLFKENIVDSTRFDIS